MNNLNCGTCDICSHWTQSDYKYSSVEGNEQKVTEKVIHGGFCDCDRFMNGYYLPLMKFKEDCITFSIELQTKSLYYTGAKFGCIHCTIKKGEK